MCIPRAIDYLQSREEIISDKIGIYGVSMGSYWSLRLASYDHRPAVLASGVACFNPNNTIFTQSSPRFKQQFMYMAGIDDEDEFDEMAIGMTVKGYADKVKCPTLLVTGEFDPLCPLEGTFHRNRASHLDRAPAPYGGPEFQNYRMRFA